MDRAHNNSNGKPYLVDGYQGYVAKDFWLIIDADGNGLPNLLSFDTNPKVGR
jgi:hypothetical protein